MRLPVADTRTTWRKLGALIMERWSEFLVVLVLQLIAAFLATVIPYIVGQAVDAVAAGTNRIYIETLISLIAVVVVCQGVFTFIANREANRFAERILHTLRCRVVDAITRLPLGTVEKVGSGDMIGRTTNDIERVQYFIQGAVSRMIIIVLTVALTCGALVVTSPALGGIVVLTVVPVYFSIRWYLRRTVPAYLAASAIQAGLKGVVSETIEQNGTADAMRLGPTRSRRADVVIREIWDNELYTAWSRAIFIFMTQALLCLPVLTAVVAGAWLLDSGTVTYGVVAATSLYALQLRDPLRSLGWWIDETQFALVALSRIFGAELADESTPDDKRDARASGREVTISEARFAYDDGDEVLHGITMTVQEGETIAVVGPSGAGKSTLGRLIAGINPPAAGSVAIGGAEVSAISEDSLHSTVAMVTQEHHVFVGTVADNLTLAKPDASVEEMLSALAAVGAEWIDDLEDGLDTTVGSGGLALTPPQAQQLALARIVLLDPGVLVLDEATSLLDPSAARSLERTLARVLEGRTVISIAHRLYTAHDADRVAVIMDGELAEYGTHDELVARGGEYARLWRAWRSD